MKQKKMVLISGPIGPIKSSNQSFMNTVKGYLKNNYKIYHFAFYSKNNPKYELKDLLQNPNYKFYGIPNFISNMVNGKNKKNKINSKRKIPSANEIIKPDSEISKMQVIFKNVYGIFEGIRQLIITPWIKPDVIYAYEIFSVNPGSMISKILKKPFIKRFQGTFIDKDDINSKKTNFHKKAYEKDCSLNIMANDGTKGDEVLKQLGFEEKKILFLLNGLDEKMTEEIEEEKVEKIIKENNLHEKDIVLGIFNRFYPFKRVDRSVHLLKEIKKEIKNPYLLIGGMGGPMEQPLKNYVKENNLQEYVNFLGQIEYDDMKYYYKSCDIILILNDYANTGNQMIESAYFGKQTIATDDENNSKILNFQNIHYVNPSNFLEEAKKEIMEIYKNKNRQEKINKEILTWEERIQKEINEVEKLIKE